MGIHTAEDRWRSVCQYCDAATGKIVWVYDPETWKDGSWKTTGAANVWTMMSADDELGYVYLPFSTPSDDHHGVHRPGYGCSARVSSAWSAHRQAYLAFSDGPPRVWDYDLPSAPDLIDIRVSGKLVKAVASVNKQGFCYAFDRVTGKPVWPIEEKPVPQSTAPGERTSPTQPPKPAPCDRQGVTDKRCNRLHAGAAQASAGNSGKVQLRSAVHAAFSREANDRDARHRRPRELVGRGGRPRRRDLLRFVGHALIRG